MPATRKRSYLNFKCSRDSESTGSFVSANGALYTSLGRSPRWEVDNGRGLKVRPILWFARYA